MRSLPRPSDVIIVGGAAGVGKTRLAAELAAAFSIMTMEFDDVVAAVAAMTTPTQQPLIHHWDSHPEARSMTAEQIVALTAEVCEALRPAAEAVIENRSLAELGLPGPAPTSPSPRP